KTRTSDRPKIFAGEQSVRPDAKVIAPLGTVASDIEICKAGKNIKADIFGFETIHIEANVDPRRIRRAAVPLVGFDHQDRSAVFRHQPVIESLKAAGTGKLREVYRKLRSGRLIQRDADIAIPEPVLNYAFSIRVGTLDSYRIRHGRRFRSLSSASSGEVGLPLRLAQREAAKQHLPCFSPLIAEFDKFRATRETCGRVIL